MITRLVILTEIIAPYRIPVFNALARNESDRAARYFSGRDRRHIASMAGVQGRNRFSYQVLPSRRHRSLGHNILLNRGLKDALRQANPDVIVCGGYNYLASWQAQSWARSHQVPFILWVESTERDRRSRNPVVEFLKTRFIRDCSAFIVPGKSSLEYVKLMGLRKMRSSPPPTQLTLIFSSRRRSGSSGCRHASKEPATAFAVFPVRGRLVHEKGVFDLLEAYGKLKPELRSEIGLVFAGRETAR